MAKTNTIRSNSLQTNSVRLNGVEGLRRVSLQAGEIPDIPPTYTLSASVTNGMVSAKRNGSAVNLPYTANEGDVIVVEVTPNDGYEFNGWADGNTDNPRTITMTADVALSAQCVEVVQPPVGNYIQFEDKAVEAVLMANNVSSDGIGITMEDAAKVTKIGTTWFYQNTEIVSFNELKYFTGVTAINANGSTGKGSFEGCTSLTSIAFPSSLTSVGQRAFLGCSALSNLENIEVLKTISLNAFYNCTSLAFDEINLPDLTSLGQNAFYGVKIKKLNLGKLTSLPSATASSQNYGDKSVLEEVVLSDSVTNIPNFSFDQYLNLRKIEGVGNVVTIGEYSCRKTMIEEFVAPNATSLLRFSFTSCTRLKHIDVGSIADVGIQALQLCSSLEKVVIRATTPPTMGNAVFGSTNSTFLIYVPDASLEAYKTATNWNQYADRIHPLSEIEGGIPQGYVKDAILSCFDGINKGGVANQWKDLSSQFIVENHGATELGNGWGFDGNSWLEADGTGYGWMYSPSRTLEVVAESEPNTNTFAILAQKSDLFGLVVFPSQNLVIPAMKTTSCYENPFAKSSKVIITITNGKAYVNGEEIPNKGQNGANGEASKFYIGRRTAGHFFKGKIYAIRIHDRILTEEEILVNQRLDNERFNLGLDI